LSSSFKKENVSEDTGGATFKKGNIGPGNEPDFVKKGELCGQN
jgi:hypothetical protein